MLNREAHITILEWEPPLFLYPIKDKYAQCFLEVYNHIFQQNANNNEILFYNPIHEERWMHNILWLPRGTKGTLWNYKPDVKFTEVQNYNSPITRPIYNDETLCLNSVFKYPGK